MTAGVAPLPDRCDLISFGGTGVTFVWRLLPALFFLERDGRLPAGRIVAISGRGHPTERYRGSLRTVLREVLGPAWTDSVGDRLLARLRHVRTDLSDDAQWLRVARAVRPGGDEALRIFHLPSTLPSVRSICAGVRRWDLRGPEGRVLLETPVGHDFASARLIGRTVASTFGGVEVYFLDHVLGVPGVADLMSGGRGAACRGAWSTGGVDHVQITVAETAGLRTSGRSFDRRGALRHMVQAQGLQLLSAVAMEPPARPGSEDVRDARCDVLRSLKPVRTTDVDLRTVRGQYVTGHRGDRLLPGYGQELGVPGSVTETFAAVRAEVRTRGWAGVPFYLRAGKRLRRDEAGVIVALRDGTVWSSSDDQPGVPGDRGVAPSHPRVLACARLLEDLLRGERARFVSSDEVEEAWRWVDPIIRWWRDGPGRPAPYAGGGVGPIAAAHLLERDGRHWRDPAC